MEPEQWLEAITRFPHGAVPWPKARSYEIEPTRQGERIRSVGPLEVLDFSAIEVAHTLASYGTRSAPRGARGIVTIANQVGLTGPWVRDARDGVTWDSRRPKMRPPREMALDEFTADLKRISNALNGYMIGYREVTAGLRPPRDEGGRKARGAFNRVMVPAVQGLITSVGWVPIEAFWGESGWYLTQFWEWTGETPPSLIEWSLAEVLRLFQAEMPVRQCANPECGRLFTKKDPGRQKAWDRSTGVEYHSDRCRNRGRYLETQRGKS